jgi:hypothetical protein
MLLSSGGSSTIASSSYAEPYYSGWSNTDVRSIHHSPYSQQQQEHQQHQQHYSWHSTTTASTTPYYFTPPPPPTTTATAAATPSSTTTSSRSHKTIRFMDDEPHAQIMVADASISRTLSESNMMMIHQKSSMEISPGFHGENALYKKGELYPQQQQQHQHPNSDKHYLHSLPMEVVETGYQSHHNQHHPTNTTNRSGFVSRRGRRPPGTTMLISRNATH